MSVGIKVIRLGIAQVHTMVDNSLIGCGNYVRPESLVLYINFILGLGCLLIARYLSLLSTLTKVACIAILSSV
jgi:hypothetical protein